MDEQRQLEFLELLAWEAEADRQAEEQAQEQRDEEAYQACSQIADGFLNDELSEDEAMRMWTSVEHPYDFELLCLHRIEYPGNLFKRRT